MLDSTGAIFLANNPFTIVASIMFKFASLFFVVLFANSAMAESRIVLDGKLYSSDQKIKAPVFTPNLILDPNGHEVELSVGNELPLDSKGLGAEGDAITISVLSSLASNDKAFLKIDLDVGGHRLSRVLFVEVGEQFEFSDEEFTFVAVLSSNSESIEESEIYKRS